MSVAVRNDLRFQRDIERLYKLGPRALGELLAEIDPKHLAALDADHFPRPPIYEVR